MPGDQAGSRAGDMCLFAVSVDDAQGTKQSVVQILGHQCAVSHDIASVWYRRKEMQNERTGYRGGCEQGKGLRPKWPCLLMWPQCLAQTK